MNSPEKIILKACLFYNVNKSDFTNGKKLTLDKFFVVVAVFYLMDRFLTVTEIQKYISKNRTTFYHYKKIISNEYSKIEPIIKKLQDAEKTN